MPVINGKVKPCSPGSPRDFPCLKRGWKRESWVLSPERRSAHPERLGGVISVCKRRHARWHDSREDRGAL
eukprot:1250367-Amorphochlora_amoeboformis.AAC.2